MRRSPLFLLLCALATAAGAQKTDPIGTLSNTGGAVLLHIQEQTEDAQAPPVPRVERIRVQDAGSRVDELRVGGETRSLTVTPAGDMPPYDIVPADGTRNRGASAGRDGSATPAARVWKLLDF